MSFYVDGCVPNYSNLEKIDGRLTVERGENLVDYLGQDDLLEKNPSSITKWIRTTSGRKKDNLERFFLILTAKKESSMMQMNTRSILIKFFKSKL